MPLLGAIPISEDPLGYFVLFIILSSPLIGLLVVVAQDYEENHRGKWTSAKVCSTLRHNQGHRVS
jgi:hypothetical protein